MKKTLLVAALFSAIGAISANAAEFSAVQADKSSISFVSKQMGVAVNGKFPKFTTQLAFDPAKPEATKVNISVDLAAIDAGSKDANDEVVGKPWFNVRMFPTATFTSTSTKAVGGGKYEITGTMNIKGKALPVVAPFTFKADGNTGTFDGTFALKRNDFAIGEGSWSDVSMVANEVQVSFRVVANASASATPAAAPATSKTPAKTK
ncbi:MAG: YceI family protein [Betaproteobacteria bacterium]|nr:YceI family protein [Betaproteobacteria bacterium]